MFCNSGVADDEVSVFFKVASTCTGFLGTLTRFGGSIKLLTSISFER
jgi:hypothetical protein